MTQEEERSERGMRKQVEVERNRWKGEKQVEVKRIMNGQGSVRKREGLGNRTREGRKEDGNEMNALRNSQHPDA